MHRGRTFRFSSAIKALGHDGGIDLHALNHYLAFGSYPGELCFWEGVRKLRPGHAAVFASLDGKVRGWAWWKLSVTPPPPHGDPEELTDEFSAVLADAVRLRLIRDVPVGIFLSGSLDSSMVTAAAARVSNAPVKTFTICVPAVGFDESPYARLVVSHFGPDHQEPTADTASLDVLDAMADALDEPMPDAFLIPTYPVSRLTRKHVTVALGGDGGHELFAGYLHVGREGVRRVLLARACPLRPCVYGADDFCAPGSRMRAVVRPPPGRNRVCLVVSA